MELYPLSFYPIYKERIWGGDKLKSLYAKDFDSNNIGESWELSTVENNISKISNGFFKDFLFTDLIEKFPVEILGTKVLDRFGKQFPLLFKFLDASDDLSIQVHPGDELAKLRHNSFGKTELWFITNAEKDSRNIIGFNKDASPELYLKNLNDKTLSSILQQEPVNKGDVFLLETGTVHAIGKGIVLAEIQQTSDITYRIYDWDRVDENGNSRELHLDLALDAINYNKINTRIDYSKEVNIANKVVSIKHFSVNYIDLKGNLLMSKTNESFRVYMCTEGSFTVNVNGSDYNFTKGSTILLPAIFSDYSISGNAELLEVFL